MRFLSALVVSALLAACSVATDFGESQAGPGGVAAPGAQADESAIDFVAVSEQLLGQPVEFSFAGMETSCLAVELESRLDPAALERWEPGTRLNLNEGQAQSAARAFTQCDLMRAYVTNVNQLGVGPGMIDEQRVCVADFMNAVADQLEDYAATQFMSPEEGRVRAAVAFDNVYSRTWDAFDFCNVGY